MASPPTRDVGTIDWASIAGSQWFDLNETVPDLAWPLSVAMYGRMRRDPRLTAILNAFNLPIRRATWRVDPTGCRDEVVQQVADDLGLGILGVDSKPGPARRRGVDWVDHLRLALLKLVYGHSAFERRYEIRGQRAHLVNLGERPAWTISAFDLNADGTIKSVTQNQAGSKPITSSRLVWYVHEREGANWSGTSLLRPAYGAWLLKHEMWRVHATSIRRFGMGVPSVTAPAGATPGQVIEAQRLASAARAGDQSGAGLPNGFEFKLTGLTGSVPDAMEYIRYLDQQMSTMALAGFLDLGQTETGSRALGESFIDLFLLSLQSIADTIAAEATSGQPGLTGIVTDLVDTNWGEDEPAPRIVCTDVGENHELNAQAIGQLVTAGVLTPDDNLQAYLRGIYGLPPRAVTTPPPPAAPVPPPVSAAKARKRASRQREVRAAGDPEAGHRQLTTVEAASGVDPDAIQEAWTSSLDDLIAQWADIAAAQQAEIAAQVSAAITAGELAALAEISVVSAPAAGLLTAAMTAMASEGVSQVVAEAASQGVRIQGAKPDEDWLTSVAGAVAQIMANSTSDTAGREAVRVATPGRSGDDVAELVTTHLQGLSDAWLRDQLGGALTAAQNHGRLAAMEAGPPATYAASEILDRATCQPCQEIDGTEFESREAAAEAYATGGYVSCLGRLRCRGVIVAVWD